MPCLRSKWAFPFENGRFTCFAGLKLVVTGATLKNAQSCHAFTLKSLNFKARLDNVSKSVNQTTFFL